ncbi:MAG TPA: ATP-binding cassette domain-containing protein [Candidatus Limnocylindria bacterium]|nr:ATP-binding cassette domain-containing protein [Candidatus Limnocylindria bacterium]
MSDAAALAAEDIWFAYVRGRSILRGVSLSVERGEVVAVLGTSGSGKTTLLKICRGLLKPTRGTVTILGEPLPCATRGALDHRIAYIPQQLGLVRALSVLDNVLLGAITRVGRMPALFHAFPPDLVLEARATLAMLGIEAKGAERAFTLSGGERQRVAIARALMQRPAVIVADEFISQLDPHNTAEIVRIFKDVSRSGVAVLMSTHEPAVVRERADRAIVLRAGEKVVDVRLEPQAPGPDLAAALRA